MLNFFGMRLTHWPRNIAFKGKAYYTKHYEIHSQPNNITTANQKTNMEPESLYYQHYVHNIVYVSRSISVICPLSCLVLLIWIIMFILNVELLQAIQYFVMSHFYIGIMHILLSGDCPCHHHKCNCITLSILIDTSSHTLNNINLLWTQKDNLMDYYSPLHAYESISVLGSMPAEIRSQWTFWGNGWMSSMKSPRTTEILKTFLSLLKEILK